MSVTEQEPGSVIDNPDGTATLPLRYPVTITYRGPGGDREQRIEALTFRRATGADIRAQLRAPDKLAASTALFCALAGLEDASFDRLDLADILAGTAIVNRFTTADAEIPREIEENPDGSKTMHLLRPVDGLDRLTLKRPTGATMRKLGPAMDHPAAAGGLVLRAIAGLSERDYDRLDAGDLLAAEAIALGFIAPSLPTGRGR